MAKRRLQPTAAIPVIEQIPVTLDPGEEARLTALAARFLAAEPALNATAAFGTEVAAGSLPGPCVLIEDHSAISLFSREQLAIYDYRALLLAGDDDTVVIGTSHNAVFESYCRDVLQLGAADVEVASASPARARRSLGLSAAEDAALLARLAARARRAGCGAAGRSRGSPPRRHLRRGSAPAWAGRRRGLPVHR